MSPTPDPLKFVKFSRNIPKMTDSQATTDRDSIYVLPLTE